MSVHFGFFERLSTRSRRECDRTRLEQTMVLAAAIVALLCSNAFSQEVVLEYQGRYNAQSGEPDHLMSVLAVGPTRAIVSGNRGLALVDFTTLPSEGTQAYEFRLPGLNARDLHTIDGNVLYANLNRTGESGSAGFAILERSGDTLIDHGTIDEPDVFFEKMCVEGGYLYVAAHAYGIRIYDLADPLNPARVGSLGVGFVDAIAIDVDGDVACVADGGGGLKIVDVSDRANPSIVEGEDVETAAGTAKDVTVRNGHVYVASGGAGVAFYENGDLANRTLYEVGACAENLTWIGDYLAVADLSGVTVLLAAPGGSLTLAGGEIAARRPPSASLRIASDCDGASGNYLLCANWNSMDVYRVLPPSASSQPDITPSVQRIRFPPDGGTADVTLRNLGGGDLVIDGVEPSAASIVCDYEGGTLGPGESVSFGITHSGASPGSGLVRFYSNDPDESPLPIQVYAETSFLDPGEASVDFSLPSYRKDPETGDYIEEEFRLSDHRGKIVWVQIYGSW